MEECVRVCPAGECGRMLMSAMFEFRRSGLVREGRNSIAQAVVGRPHAPRFERPMNLPNSITLSRIVSVPLLIWILSPAFPVNHSTHGMLGGEQELIASGVFILASITDGLDGYLARKRKQITTLGMLLDPLADKLMVAAAYIILVAYNPRIVPPWIAVIIIGREFLVSGLRSIAASEGFTIEASEIGKLKTVIQIVSVVAAILAHRWDYWLWFPTKSGGGFVIAVHMIALWAKIGRASCRERV